MIKKMKMKWIAGFASYPFLLFLRCKIISHRDLEGLKIFHSFRNGRVTFLR